MVHCVDRVTLLFTLNIISHLTVREVTTHWLSDNSLACFDIMLQLQLQQILLFLIWFHQS